MVDSYFQYQFLGVLFACLLGSDLPFTLADEVLIPSNCPFLVLMMRSLFRITTFWVFFNDFLSVTNLDEVLIPSNHLYSLVLGDELLILSNHFFGFR